MADTRTAELPWTYRPVTLDAKVRAIVAFVTDEFGLSTGQIVNVDGGQAAAFLR